MPPENQFRRTDQFMKNRMIVVTNLGTFKAFHVEQDGNSSPRLEQISIGESPNEHTKRSNTLTVMEGKSASIPGNQGMNGTGSDGEQHNMELEKRRRAIKKIAENLLQLLSTHPERTCFLAAPKEIAPQIVEALHPTMRPRIQKTLPLDLTWAPKADLIDHFYLKEAA